MSNKTKISFIIASSLTILGLLLFASVMTSLGWDFTKLNTVKKETNTHIISEEFYNISIQTDTTDIVFLPSEDSKAKIVCREDENARHKVSVENGTLTVKEIDSRKWYEYIGINFGSTKITVYIPAKEYGELKVKTITGDIRVKNMSFDSLDLSVSTGDITVADMTCKGDIKIKVTTGETKLSYITCKNFISSGSTGDVNMKYVIAQEKMSVVRDTGDIEFKECDAFTVYLKTDTGDIEGSFITGKDFNVKTDTGDIDVPKNVTGGKCEIITDTGDIEIKIS